MIRDECPSLRNSFVRGASRGQVLYGDMVTNVCGALGEKSRGSVESVVWCVLASLEGAMSFGQLRCR